MQIKIQFDLSSTKLLLQNEDRSVFVEMTGSKAKEIAVHYGLQPLTKVYVEGEVSKKGELRLGHVLRNQGW